jgi:hypothetical protein
MLRIIVGIIAALLVAPAHAAFLLTDGGVFTSFSTLEECTAARKAAGRGKCVESKAFRDVPQANEQAPDDDFWGLTVTLQFSDGSSRVLRYDNGHRKICEAIRELWLDGSMLMREVAEPILGEGPRVTEAYCTPGKVLAPSEAQIVYDEMVKRGLTRAIREVLKKNEEARRRPVVNCTSLLRRATWRARNP